MDQAIQAKSNLSDLIKQVEQDLLDEILEGLKNSKIPLPEAEKLAHDFLELLPFKDKQDLLNKLQEFSDEYPETNGVYVKYLSNEKKEEGKETLKKMRDFIKTGDIGKAIAVAKGEN
jgi:hypothetical protein